ncbi:glycine C-acetyltransferase [Pelagibius sp.]|uniref:glycine C-acetyltransferase n=1 Tax=Pelagibius sp. TaxID=1931238 RepID=UPI00262C20FC|nr:glycine C-acetyltransferase [Pelagibius sp.]
MLLKDIRTELDSIRAAHLYKVERPITSPQGAGIRVAEDGSERTVINLCANNYLGLADHPALIAAAKEALDHYGLGMASVRFICGTQDQHRLLEQEIAAFLGQEDAILYAACFDANGGVFEPLLGAEDAVISDALNHASIIDGIRLCKAQRYRYANRDMDELEAKLREARQEGARRIIIATDGVFSMDGYLADLPTMRRLADQYEALLFVDDCHSTGVLGPQGRGTGAHFGVGVDILTGTLGKALGGSAGGYVAAPQPIIDLLRQRSRPYLFSNSLPPPIVGAGRKAIELVRQGDDLRARLTENARRFRAGLTDAGFRLLEGEHPIIPVMLGEAEIAQEMAAKLFDHGIYVTGFFYPVVPQGQARIRTQMSAALAPEQIDRAVAAFTATGRDLGVI